MKGYVWMWFEGDEDDLRALETIFGPQPFVRRVIRPDGTVVIRGRARLWSVDWLERVERGEIQTDLARTEAIIAWFYDEGEVALIRRCRKLGLDVQRALEIYRTLKGMTVEEARAWLNSDREKPNT